MERKSLTRVLAVCVGVLCLAVLSISPIKAQTVKFQDLLEASRKEAAQGSTFLVYALSPRQERTRKAMLAAFKKKYELADFRAEWLMLHQNVAVPRVMSEIRAGRSGPDIFEPSINWALDVKQAGFLEPFDWVGTFGRELPGIQEAADQRIPTELKGMWVRSRDADRAFVYNTNLLKREEVPHDIEELTHPKWSRRFAMGATSPFDLLVLEWGERRTIDVFSKLVANRPIIVKGTPAVNNAVAAGQAAIGFGGIQDAEQLKVRKGAPIEWKTYGNLLPVLGLGIAVTIKAPHPNLARLFTAWFATEGAVMWEEMEGITRVSREGSRLLELIRMRAPNIKIVEPMSQEELGIHQAVRAKLEKILAGGS